MGYCPAVEQLKILKNKPHLPSEEVKLRSADSTQIDTVDQDLAPGGLSDSKDETQKGCLSRTARAGDKDKLPLSYSQVEFAEGIISPKGFG